jgi:hypothetical protein
MQVIYCPTVADTQKALFSGTFSHSSSPAPISLTLDTPVHYVVCIAEKD